MGVYIYLNNAPRIKSNLFKFVLALYLNEVPISKTLNVKYRHAYIDKCLYTE